MMAPALLLAAAAVAGPLPSSSAAGCHGPVVLAVKVDVVSTALSVKTDFSAAELRAMSPGPHRHPPIGYYRNDVGYRLAVNVSSAAMISCPVIRIAAQLVVTRQEIELARDLRSDTCRFELAEAHYFRHAAAAASMLDRTARDLRGALQHAVAQLPPLSIDGPAARDQLDAALRPVILAALDRFTASTATVRDTVDTPAEVARLKNGCPPP